ncbi:MAG: PAS domain-containing protein, partial [Chloroflexota bacterium]|nr:PAS domain-containing protein [Chloroflexota bacterium]
MTAEIPLQESTGPPREDAQGRFDVDPLQVLARAGEQLGASLDVEETLTAVARFLVPELADWCAIDIRDDEGPPRRVALIHATGSLQDAADEVRRSYLVHHAPHPHVDRVLRSGRAELHADIPDEAVAENAADDRQHELLRRLGVRSAILAPLVARDRVLGVLTMVAGHSGRRYTPRELALVEELGRRIGLAVDNARLYRHARAAEAGLRRSEERLKRALAAARMATFEWDTRTDAVARSPGHEALFGLAPGSMEGSRRAFLELIHPDDRERIQFRLEDGPGEPQAHDHEFRVVWPDGTIRWLARRATVFSDADGRPVRMVGTTMDVTDRRVAEEEARRSNERVARILESISEGFYALDAEWRFTYINQQADAMMRAYDPNHARERLIGARIETVFPGLHESPFGAALRAARRTGEPQHAEATFGPAGQWWEFNICRSDDGISVFYREVTERKRADREREQLLAERQQEAERLRALHQRLQRSLDALLGLHEVGQVLTATRDIDRVGGRLLEIARRAASLDAAAISRAMRRGGFRLWKRNGPEAIWRAARRSAEARHARRVALNARAAQGYAIPPQAYCPNGLQGWCLPLKQGDDVVGYIEAFGTPRPAEEATAAILGSMAHQLATALQNARLYNELKASERTLHELVGRLMRAQEEERRWLALEVHDGLAQLATSAQMHLEAFAFQCPPQSDEARASLHVAVGLTQQVVAEIRRVLAGLRPQLLDDYGLAQALAVYVERLSDDGWNVTYREGLGAERLPEEIEIALFRVAQEALANVRKHAGTRRVWVELDRDERG